MLSATIALTLAAADPVTLTWTDDALVLRLVAPPAQVRVIARAAHTHADAAEGVILYTGEGRAELRLPTRKDGADLLFRRFEVQDLNSGQALAEPQWVTDFALSGRATDQRISAEARKGLTCVVDLDEAAALGVRQVALNVRLGDWVRPGSTDTSLVTRVDGRIIPLHARHVARMDDWLRRAQAHGMAVTAVFYAAFDRQAPADHPHIHPQADRAGAPNAIGALNTATAEGVLHLRALLEFLAARYAGPASTYGRLHGLVVGNEVQSHWMWHNQGNAAPEDVVRDYQVALRLADLAFRRVHADFRVYASLDHFWNRRFDPGQPLPSMPGRELLDRLLAEGRRGGDFPWHVAFHPYPENLFDPRFWNDHTAPDADDTPRITFRNLAVLDRYLRRPEHTYRGQPRRIALTEQGFNHNPKLDRPGEWQAAAYVRAWQAVRALPLIESFHYHRHEDALEEGGLRLGLRPHPTRPEPTPRPLRAVFAAADTAEEVRVFGEALRAVGGAEPR
jgi:hypothetical protein